MARSSRPTIVYRYGARVLDGLDAYRDEERAMHRAYNVLAEVRHREIETAREILRTHAPWVAETEAAIDAITVAIDELRGAVKRNNSAQRKRAPDPLERERIRELQAERRALTGVHQKDAKCDCFRCRRKRAFADPEIAAVLAESSATFRGERKQLYADREISWCDWNEVARRLPSGGWPQFRAWRNTGGQVVAQIQGGGTTWADLLAGEAEHAQHVRIEAAPMTDAQAGSRHRAGRPWYLVRLRVGPDSRQRQEPRWVTARMTLHRAVPGDAVIQQVQIVRRRVGTHDKWHVHLILSRASGWDRPHGDGVAALNLGYRAVGDGERRVGYLVDDSGRTHEYRLPARFDGALRKCEDLQRIRDERFAAAHATLLHWLASADVPDWFCDATVTLAQWRSQARLAALVICWRDLRFTGDSDIFTQLASWQGRDRHLYDWQAFQRAKVQRQRTEMYRVWAAELRARYATVLIDDTDYRAITRTPPAESHDTPEALNTRWYLRLCAPGLLRDAIVQAGIGRPVNPADITTTCSTCGSAAAGDWNRVSEIRYRCAVGHVVDQDANAANNMLARANGEVVQP